MIMPSRRWIIIRKPTGSTFALRVPTDARPEPGDRWITGFRNQREAVAFGGTAELHRLFREMGAGLTMSDAYAHALTK